MPISMNRFKHISGTHHKLLTLLLVGLFFSVPLVTAAGFSLSGILISITGFILGVAGNLFNKTMELFVLQMGGLIAGPGGVGIGLSINVIWRIVRDLVNLTFIFGLVYIGFKTILNAGTDTKKLLASIIIGALLVNFSLFISKVVIDVSNVTASQIYKQMGIKPGTTLDPQMRDLGIADAFMARMGILNLVTVPNTKGALTTRNAGTPIGDTESYLAFVVGSTIFILVASFIFFAGAILLAIRFVVLVILMMLSPIAFAATVFPVFKGWSEKWWHTLFSQAFFAPAYLFMLYITLVVAQGYQTQVRNADGIYTPSQFSNGFTTIAFFCITIGLMVASLILAKQMGAIGAGKVLAVGKNLASRTRRRVQSFAGRNTIGRAAQLGAYTNAQLEQSKAGRIFKGVVSAASLGTFTERARRTTFEAGKKAKFGGTYSRADDIQSKSERDKATAIYNDIENGIKIAEKHAKANTAPVPGLDDQKALTAFARAMTTRTTKDLENMQVSLISNENVAIHLTADQVKGIENSEKFSRENVKKIKDAREKALVAAGGRTSVPFGTPPTSFGDVYGPKTLQERGENELSKMPLSVLTMPKMAPYLTPNIIEHILKEGRANATELNELKLSIEGHGGTLPATDPYVQKFKRWNTGNNVYGNGFPLTLP